MTKNSSDCERGSVLKMMDRIVASFESGGDVCNETSGVEFGGMSMRK